MSVSILNSSRPFGDCCDCVVCAVSPEVIVTKVDAEVIIRVTVAATEHLGGVLPKVTHRIRLPERRAPSCRSSLVRSDTWLR